MVTSVVAPRAALSGRVLGVAFEQLVRHGLRGIWLRGSLPPSPLVWAANHHSWWDGFVAAAILKHYQRPACLLMDSANLADYRFLDAVGVVPANRPRRALAQLRTSRVLVMFPEGALRSPGPMGALAPGAGWFARHAPANLVPVAVRVVLRGQQYPEAIVDIGPPCPEDDLADVLSGQLATLDAEVRMAADPRCGLPGFVRLLGGRSSWDERISRWSSPDGWDRS
jgi:1-acyl-sn-glycerol-3-phosphate acyltransferase